jgi:hypothetical protein
MLDCEEVDDLETGYGLVLAVLIGLKEVQIRDPGLPIGPHQQRFRQPRRTNFVIVRPRDRHL